MSAKQCDQSGYLNFCALKTVLDTAKNTFFSTALGGIAGFTITAAIEITDMLIKALLPQTPEIGSRNNHDI